MADLPTSHAEQTFLADRGGAGERSTGTHDSEAHAVAIRLVRDFLAALEARDLDRAQAHVALDARIVVPGGREVRAVADIVANSVRRYARVGKHIEHIETLAASDGGVVAYCRGTLHGAWSDGTAFAGIRFIDRFELRDGRITLQEVWNDAAERRAALARH